MLATVNKLLLIGAAFSIVSILDAHRLSAQPTSIDQCLDKYQYQRDMKGLSNNLDIKFNEIDTKIKKMSRTIRRIYK